MKKGFTSAARASSILPPFPGLSSDSIKKGLDELANVSDANDISIADYKSNNENSGEDVNVVVTTNVESGETSEQSINPTKEQSAGLKFGLALTLILMLMMFNT